MATSLEGDVKLSGLLDASPDLTSLVEEFKLRTNILFTEGTSDNQINKIFSGTRTLPYSGGSYSEIQFYKNYLRSEK